MTLVLIILTIVTLVILYMFDFSSNIAYADKVRVNSKPYSITANGQKFSVNPISNLSANNVKSMLQKVAGKINSGSSGQLKNQSNSKPYTITSNGQKFSVNNVKSTLQKLASGNSGQLKTRGNSIPYTITSNGQSYSVNPSNLSSNDVKSMFKNMVSGGSGSPNFNAGQLKNPGNSLPYTLTSNGQSYSVNPTSNLSSSDIQSMFQNYMSANFGEQTNY